MPGIETLVGILTIAMTIISVLGGVVWNMLRQEAKEHSDLIGKKVDIDRVHELEARWQAELTSVKDGSEKLFNRLESRHDKEMDALATRLGEQIRNTETNILTQIRLMIQVIQSGK